MFTTAPSLVISSIYMVARCSPHFRGRAVPWSIGTVYGYVDIKCSHTQDSLSFGPLRRYGDIGYLSRSTSEKPVVGGYRKWN